MNFPRMTSLALAAVVAVGAGCSSLDVDPPGDPERVISGTVRTGVTLPAGAEIAVRLIATPAAETPRPAAGDVPVATRPAAPPPERVLGEFTTRLADATNDAVPFRIQLQADDALLRRGVNLEARVSIDGRLRFRTINAHAVTLNSARFPQEIAVQPVGR